MLRERRDRRMELPKSRRFRRTGVPAVGTRCARRRRLPTAGTTAKVVGEAMQHRLLGSLENELKACNQKRQGLWFGGEMFANGLSKCSLVHRGPRKYWPNISSWRQAHGWQARLQDPPKGVDRSIIIDKATWRTVGCWPTNGWTTTSPASSNGSHGSVPMATDCFFPSKSKSIGEPPEGWKGHRVRPAYSPLCRFLHDERSDRSGLFRGYGPRPNFDFFSRIYAKIHWLLFEKWRTHYTATSIFYAVGTKCLESYGRELFHGQMPVLWSHRVSRAQWIA